MSCNCGCHDDKVPAMGWRRYAPFIVGVAVVGALIAGAILKTEDKSRTAPGSTGIPTTTAPRP